MMVIPQFFESVYNIMKELEYLEWNRLKQRTIYGTVAHVYNV